MPFLGRGTLPQNYIDFFESVGRNTRLPTPQPQYFFARMALGARMRIEAVRNGFSSIEDYLRMGMEASGAVLPTELDAMVRAADAYPEAVKAMDDFGKGRGDTIKFQRDVYTAG